MRPLQLALFLGRCIDARLPVLITGEPGIGKSDIVAQACAEADADLIISHPAVADPTDAKGFPWADGDQATFLPFGELAQALKATKQTVWFLDDLGQATPAVQASFMQLLLARRVNGHKLPDCVTFVAATNSRKHRAGVSGILEPVKSRFAAIIELQSHIDDWCNWAFDNDQPPTLIAFLRFRPDLLCKFEASADMTNSPLPRTWSHVGALSELNLPADIRRQAFAGAVGEGASTEYLAFEAIWKQMPNIDAILMDPDSAMIPDKPATRYAVVTALAMKATEKNFGRIARYAERLTTEASAGEFAALLVRDCLRRDGDLANTSDFIRLASGDLGQLISGGPT